MAYYDERRKEINVAAEGARNAVFYYILRIPAAHQVLLERINPTEIWFAPAGIERGKLPIVEVRHLL